MQCIGFKHCIQNLKQLGMRLRCVLSESVRGVVDCVCVSMHGQMGAAKDNF